MTRYSASRGIIYSAPPGPSGERRGRTGSGAGHETGTSDGTETDGETEIDGEAETSDEPGEGGEGSESTAVEAAADD